MRTKVDFDDDQQQTEEEGTSSKNVLVLSSPHNSSSLNEVFVDPEESTLKKKTNTIIDYNNTKYGVDSLDQS